MTRFPSLDERPEEIFKGGAFNEAAARAAFAGWTDAGYLVWGNDNRAVIAFALEFVSQLTTVTRHVEEDMTTDAHTAAESASDRRMERRMERGRFAYTRFDITSRGGGIRVRVSCANPNDVPGTAIASARRFGVYACRILLHLKREISDKRSVTIELEGVGDMDDIFKEAAWTDERMVDLDVVERANEKRRKCPKALGGYCSPSDPDCRCYSGGKCVEARLDEKYLCYRREAAQ